MTRGRGGSGAEVSEFPMESPCNLQIANCLMVIANCKMLIAKCLQLNFMKGCIDNSYLFQFVFFKCLLLFDNVISTLLLCSLALFIVKC